MKGSVLVASLLLWEKHNQKQPGERRVYFSLQLTVHHGRESGQELKAEVRGQELKQVHGGVQQELKAEVQGQELKQVYGGVQRPGLPSLFSYTALVPCLGVELPWWALPQQLAIKKKVSQTFPMDNVMERIPPLSRVSGLWQTDSKN